MLSRRLQVLVEPSQYERLRRAATLQGVSVGEFVRSAIDRAVAPARPERERALRRFLDAETVDLPADPADLERELDELLIEEN
jgi:uncharacterized protein (DUF1778 family)